MNALKKQQKYYFGKKKKHTIIIQIAADADDLKILCIATAEGKKHDFNLFKDSKLHFLKNTLVLADKGYLGIDKLHSNSKIPKKTIKETQINTGRKSIQF